MIKTNFYVMDEILSFADEDNIEKIKNLFDYMKSLYDFVIVISHDEKIKEYCDKDIIIKHNCGYSKVYLK